MPQTSGNLHQDKKFTKIDTEMPKTQLIINNDG